MKQVSIYFLHSFIREAKGNTLHQFIGKNWQLIPV